MERGGGNSQVMEPYYIVMESPSNPPTARDWQRFRPIFIQLYSKENRKLEEVREVMHAGYYFQATSVFPEGVLLSQADDVGCPCKRENVQETDQGLEFI